MRSVKRVACIETYLYVHTGTVFSRHHAALAQKWGECEKICRITKIAEYVEEHEVKREPYHAFGGVVNVELRNERDDPSQKVRPATNGEHVQRSHVTGIPSNCLGKVALPRHGVIWHDNGEPISGNGQRPCAFPSAVSFAAGECVFRGGGGVGARRDIDRGGGEAWPPAKKEKVGRCGPLESD